MHSETDIFNPAQILAIMATKLNEVKLPEWVWVSGGEHERNGNPLENRMIIMHVHTATIIEMFNDGDFIPNGGGYLLRGSAM